MSDVPFHDPADDEPDPYRDDDDDELAEAEMNCGLMHDGFCMQAGSEYCDWECPFADELRQERMTAINAALSASGSEG